MKLIRFNLRRRPETTGRKVAINPDYIVAVVEEDDGPLILTSTGVVYYPEGTVEDVLGSIPEERAP